MSWKKYFKLAPKNINVDGKFSPISNLGPDGTSFNNYQSSLPDVYTGHPNRLERYNQYEVMDTDSEINTCLDIIAEFSTHYNDVTQLPFDIHYNEKPSDTEVKLISTNLRQWIKLNELDKRIFKIFRNTIKYGDQVFIRDPETFKLFWIEPTKVMRVIVNESEGKVPEQYVIQELNVNLQNLTVAIKSVEDFQIRPPSGGYSAPNTYTIPVLPNMASTRFQYGPKEVGVDAKHVVHLSLTEGLDFNWPFGQSILEQAFKVYKQKELIEDAILIYRIQRAPERRVFKINTGNMPTHLAMSFVERIKNEIHQRRIPSQHGGTNVLDATYNPLSINEDYFFPVGADGSGSSVDILKGGDNLGEINDLKYFNNKLARALRVPSSYLPTGPEESERTFNDGRLGTALIQEYHFNKYCERLQNTIIDTLSDEFKQFLVWRGLNIDAKLFDLKFCKPQNFSSGVQIETDNQRLNAFKNVIDVPFISKQFAIKRYLGLSEEEISENEKLWKEENNFKEEEDGVEGSDLRGVGVTPGDLDSDIDTLGDLGAEDFGAEEGGGEAEFGGETGGEETGLP